MSGGEVRRDRRLPSATEVVAFVEAVAALASAALLVALMPFRILTRTIAAPRADAGANKNADGAADAVTLAVERAARRLPLRLVCLHKGLATHWMLRRRGVMSHVHYGVSPAGAVLQAHVWVDVGGRTVIGEAQRQAFARVATFPIDAKAAAPRR